MRSGSKIFELRKFVESDLRALHAIESNKFLKQFVGGEEKRPFEVWLPEAKSTILTCNYQLALVETATGILAGRVSLGHWNSSDTREVQVILAESFVGRRLGDAAVTLACEHAFANLAAERVVGVVDRKHRASLDLVSRLGFEEFESDSPTKRYFELTRPASR